MLISKAEFQLLKEDRDNQKKIAAEALGQIRLKPLIKGIGHELQNTLGVIISGMDLIEENTDNPQAISHYCELVKNAMMKLSDVANLLIHNGSTTTGKQNKIAINKLLSDICELAKGECKKRKITLETEFNATSSIVADESILFQGLMELLYNSLESIEQNGKIMIRTDEDETSLSISILESYSHKKQSSHKLDTLSITERAVLEHHWKVNTSLRVGGEKTVKISIPLNGTEMA